MNIAIVGAGIAGLSTALELARDGHHVTIYEQCNAAAEGASFAPGGWLSPCAPLLLSTPGSGMPLKQLRRTLQPVLHAPGWPGSTNWRWLRQWKRREKALQRPSNAAPATPTTPPAGQALQQLTDYSQQLRHAQAAAWGIDLPAMHEQHTGQLVLLRKVAEVDFWQSRLQTLQQQGVSAQLIDAPAARALEPSLSTEMPLAGALQLPQGETLNGRLWAQHLRQQVLAMGVQLHTGTTVQRIDHQPVCVHLKATAQRPNRTVAHDAVVLCTGADTTLLQYAKVPLPALPLWGYSVTAPVRDPLQAPRTAVMDWHHQTTMARLGQRIRITAGAELNAAADAPHHAPTLARMYQLLNDWFPGGAQLSSAQVQVWRGARGMLPDGLPAVGATAQPGIWLNLAHGSHGIATAAGCARALADALQGAFPVLDLQAFSPQRF